MDFLPTDWKSFLWGVAVGAFGAFFAGFLKKFGEDAYSSLKSKWFPEPPEPVKVDGKFVPTAFEPAKCAWVPEGTIYNYETQNYFYYPHPKTGGKCFRVVGEGASMRNEFLMVAPDTEKIDAL